MQAFQAQGPGRRPAPAAQQLLRASRGVQRSGPSWPTHEMQIDDLFDLQGLDISPHATVGQIQHATATIESRQDNVAGDLRLAQVDAAGKLSEQKALIGRVLEQQAAFPRLAGADRQGHVTTDLRMPHLQGPAPADPDNVNLVIGT